MPSPQIISHSGVALAASSNLTLRAPPLLADDDILVAVFASTSNAQVAAISGFTQKISTDSTNFAGHRTVLWKRASSESGDYTTTGLSAGTNFGILLAVRYGKLTGDPFNTTSSTDKSNTGTALTCSAITTTVDGCLLLTAFPQPNSASVSAYTDGGPTLTWQEEVDIRGTGTISIGSAVQAAQAAITPTATNSSTGFAHMIALAIEPDTSSPTSVAAQAAVIARLTRRLVS